MDQFAKEDIKAGIQTSMPDFSKRSIVFWSFPFLMFLGGCDAKPVCESPETRLAVLQTVSNNHGNALVEYAAKNPNTAKPTKATPEAPLYLLGDKIITTSANQNKQALECSGSISVTVGNTKATKDVNFTGQQSPDGKISVSVAPFQF